MVHVEFGLLAGRATGDWLVTARPLPDKVEFALATGCPREDATAAERVFPDHVEVGREAVCRTANWPGAGRVAPVQVEVDFATGWAREDWTAPAGLVPVDMDAGRADACATAVWLLAVGRIAVSIALGRGPG